MPNTLFFYLFCTSESWKSLPSPSPSFSLSTTYPPWLFFPLFTFSFTIFPDPISPSSSPLCLSFTTSCSLFHCITSFLSLQLTIPPSSLHESLSFNFSHFQDVLCSLSLLLSPSLCLSHPFSDLYRFSLPSPLLIILSTSPIFSALFPSSLSFHLCFLFRLFSDSPAPSQLHCVLAYSHDSLSTSLSHPFSNNLLPSSLSTTFPLHSHYLYLTYALQAHLCYSYSVYLPLYPLPTYPISPSLSLVTSSHLHPPSSFSPILRLFHFPPLFFFKTRSSLENTSKLNLNFIESLQVYKTNLLTAFAEVGLSIFFICRASTMTVSQHFHLLIPVGKCTLPTKPGLFFMYELCIGKETFVRLFTSSEKNAAIECVVVVCGNSFSFRSINI